MTTPMGKRAAFTMDPAPICHVSATGCYLTYDPRESIAAWPFAMAINPGIAEQIVAAFAACYELAKDDLNATRRAKPLARKALGQVP